MAGLFGGKNTVTEAERISEFQVNSATYGAVVPVVFGTTRISGNIIDYFNFTATAHDETTRTGKGGGSSTTNRTWDYKAAVLLGLAEGPAAGVGKVWKGTDTITTLAALGLNLFAGAQGQSPWAYTQGQLPEHALPYSGLAYVAGYIDLSSSGGVDTYNFELQGLLRALGDGIDCNPADITNYIMSDAVNGIGITGINAAALTNFWTYCQAADLLGSLPLTDQSKAYEIVNNLCAATNTMVFDSQGELKFVPRCEEIITANNVTYTPDLTVQYDLDEDDFLEFDDGTLVKFERVDASETYNQATVEFINRANGYEVETVDQQVLADISKRGLRPASTATYHFFHTKARAEQVALELALKSCYMRVTYTFRLPWNFCRLEPGDIVTLSLSTGPFLLNRVPVRIETVDEDEDGELEFTAKPLMSGIASPAKYTVFDSDRASRDLNVDPGDSTSPVIFEAPDPISGATKTFIAAAGGGNWGGCNIWASDDGSTYRQIGSLAGACRYGELTAGLPVGDAVDIINTLAVDLSDSGGELGSGTQADAQNMRTLCWVDGELIAYQTATLTGVHKYNLSYLVRGRYNSPIIAHAAGSRFVRMDSDRLFGYEFPVDNIGKTFYAKLQSFNIYGSGAQDLSNVSAVSHTIATYPPPSVASLSISLSGSDLILAWPSVSSSGVPVNGYYIRRGDTYGTGQMAATVAGSDVSQTKISALRGTHKYWIAAYNQYGVSANPAGDSITITSIPKQNYVDEKTNYEETGTLSGYGKRFSGILVQGSTLIYSDMTTKTWTELSPLRWMDPAGSVSVVGDVVDIGKASTVLLSVVEKWMRTPDTANVWKYKVSNDNVAWTEWALVPLGEVYGRYFQFQLTVGGVTQCGILESASIVIDVPEKTYPFQNTPVPIGGVDIVFPEPFVQRPILAASGIGAAVKVQMTALAVDDIFLTGVRIAVWSDTADIGGIVDLTATGF